VSLAPLAVRGIGAWGNGMPDWAAMRAVARGDAAPAADAPKKPAPALLPPNERRRAPDSVLLALQVAQAAYEAAGADAAATPSIFASMHGDLAITDATCRTLADVPTDISPTRFHNSVHNAASGYWTIGVGSHAPSTALSAYRATFAQGLLEAAMQLDAGAMQVLLVAYDSAASGPLAAVSCSEGLLGVALLLDRSPSPALRLTLALQPGEAPPLPAGMLRDAAGGNAMAPALALVDAIANERAACELPAGQDLVLRVELAHG
jgi:hypothetical protein